MRPISIDLRLRIVAAVESGEHSLRELAGLFRADLSTIVRLLQRFRSTGSVQPKAHGGGARPKLDAEAVARLLELVRQQPDATLAELRSRLGIACSIMTIFRVLRRQGITRKKKTRHAEERDTARVQKQRRIFRKKIATVAPEHLVFVDETGATTAMVTVSRHCVIGFTMLQEKSERGPHAREALINRWTKTAFLKPGKNVVVGRLPDPNGNPYAVHPKCKFQVDVLRRLALIEGEGELWPFLKSETRRGGKPLGHAPR